MDDTREPTQRVFDAYNAHDLGALRALYTPDARTHRSRLVDALGGPAVALAG